MTEELPKSGRKSHFKDSRDVYSGYEQNADKRASRGTGKDFCKGKDFKNLYITVMSFGFKYGIPQDADLVFDVRFLPNPYYIEELRAKTGNEAEVRDYVMKSDKAQEFFRQLSQMMDFLIPNYILEGKNQLVVAVGCTGGKHRSVTLANALYQYLEVRENYGVRIEHRDIEKDAIRKGK